MGKEAFNSIVNIENDLNQRSLKMNIHNFKEEKIISKNSRAVLSNNKKNLSNNSLENPLKEQKLNVNDAETADKNSLEELKDELDFSSIVPESEKDEYQIINTFLDLFKGINISCGNYESFLFEIKTMMYRMLGFLKKNRSIIERLFKENGLFEKLSSKNNFSLLNEYLTSKQVIQSF